MPIFQKGRFRGFVLGYFDAQRSLGTMLRDIAELNFSMAIEESGTEVFRLAGSNNENLAEWAQKIDVNLPGTTWHLRVWPKPEAMSEMRSKLPMATLLFGTAAGLMLMVIARIASFCAPRSNGFPGSWQSRRKP